MDASTKHKMKNLPKFSFKVYGKKKQYSLETHDFTEKQEWLDHIDAAITTSRFVKKATAALEANDHRVRNHSTSACHFTERS